MQSFLITGSNEKGRLLKVEKIIGKKISSLINNPDFLLLQAGESSIGIAEVRNLQEKLFLKPFQEKEKIALIQEAQNLTIEAQNALLKTLEEPNASLVIFLTAPDSYWLLPTVTSRCEIISLPAKSSVEVTEKEFEKILEVLNNLLSSSIGKRFKIIEEEGIAKDRQTATDWLDKLTCVVRQLLLASYQISNQPNIEQSNVEQSLNLTAFQCLSILSTIKKYKNYLGVNCNVKLTLEVFLIELFSPFSP